MKLREMSVEYQEAAQIISDKIKLLKPGRPANDPELNALYKLRSEIRKVGEICENYYEKGYWRDDRFCFTVDTASTNDEALLRAKNVLSKAIQTELTAKQQEYLLMQFCDGLTVTEISRRCGVDKSVVSRTISRAKRRLYHCIKYAML